MITGFIRDQIDKTGVKGAVIGLSGGIDSALSAYL
ncbi:MAG: NAD(+) synthetase, partial [Phototrophicaceae bacterium]